MRLGIIGLPQSGKTTLFNALTRATQPVGVYRQNGNPYRGGGCARSARG